MSSRLAKPIPAPRFRGSKANGCSRGGLRDRRSSPTPIAPRDSLLALVIVATGLLAWLYVAVNALGSSRHTGIEGHPRAVAVQEIEALPKKASCPVDSHVHTVIEQLVCDFLV